MLERSPLVRFTQHLLHKYIQAPNSLCDLIIVCADGDTFYSFHSVMTVRVPLLAQYITQNSGTEFRLDINYPGPVVKAFLYYVYLDELDTNINLKQRLDLLKLSASYCITPLLNKLTTVMENSLTHMNVGQIGKFLIENSQSRLFCRGDLRQNIENFR